MEGGCAGKGKRGWGGNTAAPSELERIGKYCFMLTY